MTWEIAYVVFAIVVAWPLTSGMIFCDLHSIGDADFARRNKRSDAGGAIALGMLFAAMWPVGLLGAWLLTGFAEHGVWRFR